MQDRLADLKKVRGMQPDTCTVDSSLNAEPENSVKEFLVQAEDIRESIKEISAKVEDVKYKQSRILSSPEADVSAQEAVEACMADIKQSARKVREKLKCLEKEIDQDQNVPITAERRIKSSQYSMLSRKFVSVMQNYNKTQSDYRDRCKNKIQRQLAITGEEVSDDEIEKMLENSSDGSPAIFTKLVVRVGGNQMTQALTDIEARHNNIMKLESSIRELHDVFMDMAILVEEQGEMIDRIEYNVDQTAEEVNRTVVNLREAVRFKTGR